MTPSDSYSDHTAPAPALFNPAPPPTASSSVDALPERPTTSARDSASERRATAVEIARAWGSLPAKHLERVLNHLEKELVREHEYRMAVHQAQEERGKRLDRLYMAGLVAGFVLCAGMLVGGVLVGMHGPGWLAGVLCGPSLIAVGALFVLRRTNDSTIREVGRVAHGPLDVPPADGPPSS